MSRRGLRFRHVVVDREPPGSHHDITLLADLTGNGRDDIIIGCKEGLVNLFWYENPTWQRHDIATAPNLEAGGVLVDITGNTTGGASDATWSPDGRRVAFQFNGALRITNADGSSCTDVPLPNEVCSLYEMAWSPDGSKIAYVADTNDAYEQIWVMDPEGGNNRIAQELLIGRIQGWGPGGREAAPR